jgi:hypothetical protein
MEPKEFSAEWFDASSEAWMKNKRRIGQIYIYICEHPSCKRKVSSTIYCTKHEKVEAIPLTQPTYPTQHTASSTLRRSPRLQQNGSSLSGAN